MKKIEAYKLSDGRVIENLTEASFAENDIQFEQELNVWIYTANGNLEDCDDAHMVLDFIIKNKEQLKKMLNKTYTEAIEYR